MSRKNKPLKRPNGHGSVYKLPGRRRRPWIALTTNWKVITDENGEKIKKQGRQIIGYFEKETDAKDALLLNRINPVSPKSNITFKELYDEWSEIKYENISKSTADNYRAGWNYLAKFESAKFKELRTAHFQSIIDGCRKEGKSRSTMEKIKAVSTMLYKYAIQNDIVNKNYAEFIVLPKSEKEKNQYSQI